MRFARNGPWNEFDVREDIEQGKRNGNPPRPDASDSNGVCKSPDDMDY